MSAGLFRLGHDFGNGRSDESFFQRDTEHERYRREKERVLSTHPERLQVASERSAQDLLGRVKSWMHDRLGREHGQEALAELGHDPGRSDWKILSLCIQEDFALLQRQSDSERLMLLSVCFPSGWRPERLLGKDFGEVHAPVAEFGAVRTKRRQLVRAMVERGPYVRFVWSLSADANLDHHPDQSARQEWRETGEGFFRVERQVTVPFPELNGSLFLIRTYVYPLSDLPQKQLLVLREAIKGLSPAVRTYKGLSSATDVVLTRLVSRG